MRLRPAGSLVSGFWVLLWAGAAVAADPAIAFETRVLDPHVGNVCYAVSAADVDGDKLPDIVAVTENRVVWFQNPTWKLRAIIENQTE